MRIIIYFIVFILFRPAVAQVEISTFYDDEKKYPKEILYLADSQSQVIQGPYTLYYLDGGIQAKGQFEEDQAVGHWEYFYENGNPKMAGNLKNNTNYGKWVFYYESGKKNREGELYDGLRQGEWTFYYENGQIKSVGRFVDSQIDGIWNYYYEDGKLKGQAYYVDGNGTYKEFYNSGSLKVEGKNHNGKSDGLWKYYYEQGQIQSEGLFVEGVKMGGWRFYHKNGVISAIGNFTAGKKRGPWKYYYEDGALSSEGVEKDDQKDGFWKLFYETGDLKGEGNFKEGTGDYKEYHSSGKLKISGRLSNGKNVGRWMYYYEDGSLEGEANFMQGDGKYTGYYPDGTLKTVGNIRGGKKVGEWRLYDERGQLAGFYKPIYEDVPPVFKTSESIGEDLDRVKYEKPEYRFRKRNSRYFTPVINEYQGRIFAINPLLIPIGRFPFSAEYYMQERLGYELQYIWLRDPFFKAKNSIDLNENYERGFTIKFRQKFYHPEGQLGMFYFAHQIAYTNINHGANVIDSTGTVPINRMIRAKESRFEYGVTIGNRWVRNSGDGGATIDVYVGVGIGYRDFNKKYQPNPEFDEVFSDVEKSSPTIPFIFGINFGWISPRREPKKK